MNRPEPKTQYLNEVPEIQERKKKRGYWADLLEEFAKRSEKCMMLEYNGVCYASTALTGIKNRITTDGLKMRVVQNDYRVYIIKEDGDETKAR